MLLNLAGDDGYLAKATCRAIFKFIVNVASIASLSARPAIYVDLLAPYLAELDFGVEAEQSGMVVRVLTDLQVLFGYLMTSLVQYTDSQVSSICLGDHLGRPVQLTLCAVLELRPRARELPRGGPAPPAVRPPGDGCAARLRVQHLRTGDLR